MIWQLLMKYESRQRPDYDFADGDYMQVRVAELDPDWPEAFQIGPAAFSFGTALSSERVPTRIKWKSAQPLYDYLTPHGATCISEEFRQLVEQLEPGVHQFLPLEMVDAKGNHLADHWIWVPLNRLDSVDREHTTMIRHGQLWATPSHFRDHELPPGYDRTQPVRMVFSTQQIGSHHFWRDRHVIGGDLFCSNHAAQAVMDAAMIGVKLTQKEAV